MDSHTVRYIFDWHLSRFDEKGLNVDYRYSDPDAA